MIVPSQDLKAESTLKGYSQRRFEVGFPTGNESFIDLSFPFPRHGQSPGKLYVNFCCGRSWMQHAIFPPRTRDPRLRGKDGKKDLEDGEGSEGGRLAPSHRNCAFRG